MKFWAFKRQLVGIGFFSIIVIVAGVALIFYVIPKPSCSDGKLNGDELGTDCGGSCKTKCIGEIPRDPLILWSRQFFVRDGVYDVGAMVENVNLEAGVRSFLYKFKVYDDDGVLLAERTGKSFLYPGEKSFIYEPTLSMGSKIPKRTDFEFVDPEWENLVQDNTLDIKIKRKVFENTQHPIIKVTLENMSLFEEMNLEISVLLENSEGNVYAVSNSRIAEIKGKSEREVLFTWPTVSFEDPKTIQVLVRRIP